MYIIYKHTYRGYKESEESKLKDSVFVRIHVCIYTQTYANMYVNT
jgi:hypothetical protein